MLPITSKNLDTKKDIRYNLAQALPSEGIKAFNISFNMY